MERGTFHDEKFIRPLNDACVPLVMPTSYKNYESVKIKGEDRYKDYPRLTVEEAKGFTHSAESAVDYKEYEKWVTPVYVIANSKKELVVKTLDRKVINVQRILQDIQAAQGKIGGKGCPVLLYRQYCKSYEAAKKAADDGDKEKARKALAEIDKLKSLTDAMKEQVSALRDGLKE
jgi:hypothetical protein